MVIRQYIQNWETYKRVIVVSDEGSVFVDLYQQPIYDISNPVKCVIWGLFVENTFRNKGIAKQLLQYAENIIKQSGESLVAVIYENSTPLWVLEWYMKNGYEFYQRLNDTGTLLIKTISITEVLLKKDLQFMQQD